MRVVGILVCLIGSVMACDASSAFADGDPASDVLAAQALFLPKDAGVPPDQEQQLLELLASAQRPGYRIRAAIIASPNDLGSVISLWNQPQRYAEFLTAELSLIYRGPVLIVMPSGYGFSDLTKPRPGGSVLPTSPPGRALGSASLKVIRRLAAARGYHLTIPENVAPRHPAHPPTMPWVAFWIGVVLIAASWTFSLRARPMRIR